MLLALAAEIVECAQPPLVAFAPGGHPFAQPLGFRRDLAVEFVELGLLGLQHPVAPGFESGEPFVEALGVSAIQPDGRARQVLEEPSVVADQDLRGADRRQFALQPFYGGQVQMVGRLVEQQDVGRRRQGPGKRRPPRFAAR